MKLTNVKIYKYKSIETEQNFKVEDGTTVLVGMNEAGKTSVLEAIGKVNYFTADKRFKFDSTHDYPRKEKKAMDKLGTDPEAVELSFKLDNALVNGINADLGSGVIDLKNITYTKKYSNGGTYGSVVANKAKFVSNKMAVLGFADDALEARLNACKDAAAFDALLKLYSAESQAKILPLKKYFANSWNWPNPISEYVARVWLGYHMPKFLYYDEYFALPSEITIEDMVKEASSTDSDEIKTARALFELADIDTKELLKADSFEDFIAELESTQALISAELFKYWTANKNLKIRFAINKVIEVKKNVNYGNQEDKIVKHVLSIRVENTRSNMTLPLKNRSKGFNWFFSFLVWFKKIQEDKKSKYILLLDEPGLNLHASAQADLLRFFDDLSKDYQIIYTTHSPFMVNSLELPSVRTVVETETGTKISDTIQEKDARTLFPLQAALGYDIAQNLFVSENNLLVEGVADLIYFTIISDLLKSIGREGLKDKITITPVGGVDKVATFVALLGASKLKLACMLDTFTDSKGKAKLEDLIRGSIIKQKNVRFFDEFVPGNQADIEDLFEPAEYINLFNEAFAGEYSIDVHALDASLPTVLGRINKVIGKKHFNHYRPARLLASKGVDISYFSSGTLDRFERVFKEVNKLF